MDVNVEKKATIVLTGEEIGILVNILIEVQDSGVTCKPNFDTHEAVFARKLKEAICE